MAFKCNDRVKETTTTTGTGTVTLAGAVTHFESFNSGIGNGSVTYYCIVHEDTAYDEWEVGVGTYTHSGTTLTRSAISSSNSDSEVSFTAGTKSVFITMPASKGVLKDNSGAFVTGDGSATGFMTELVDDTSPQLGGDLDLNSKNLDFPTTSNISDCLDEDSMSSDSATMLATQQSIKAYADTKLAAVVDDTSPQLGGDLDLNSNNLDFPTTSNISDCLDEDSMSSDSATMLATQQSIKAYADTKLAAVVDDTSPQLGGDLDLNSQNLDFPTTSNISDCLDEDAMGSNSATALATQQSIKAYADTKASLGDATALAVALG